MGLLKTEPQGVVESLPELMAIAKAMEDEAACRYRQLARRMQSIGNKAVEDVFAHLAHQRLSSGRPLASRKYAGSFRKTWRTRAWQTSGCRGS